MLSAQKKTLAALVAMAILSLSQACSPRPPYPGAIDRGEAQCFLKDNRQLIDLAKGLTTPSLLDTSLAPNDVFLSGEAHGVAEMKDVRLALLKYLHDRAGVRYLLVESGYGSTLLVQKYLDTGDEAWLKESFRLLQGTFAFSRQSYDGWKDIYEWNMSLPEADRVRIAGIDVEHQAGTGFSCLRSLLPDQAPPNSSAEIASLSARLKETATKASVSRDEADALLKDLEQSLAANASAWQEYLGKDLFDFNFTVKTIRQGLDFYGQNADARFREESMFSNFVEVYAHLGGGKFYGQIGNAHVLLQRNIDETLCHLMNSDSRSPVVGKVVSIPTFFEGCESVVDPSKWTVKKYTDDKSNVGIFGPTLDLLRSAQESDLTLLRLVGEGSPLMGMGVNTGGKDISVSDYFQYVLLVRNGHATTKMSW